MFLVDECEVELPGCRPLVVEVGEQRVDGEEAWWGEAACGAVAGPAPLVGTVGDAGA